MDPYLTHYQSANISDEQSIQNFVVRKKEFERVMSDIRSTDKESSFQHYVFVGRRGSGKSTLLRRIQAEVSSDVALRERLLVINLSEEQTGIYKLYDLWDYVLRDLRSKGYPAENPDWQDYADDMKTYTHKLYAIVSECLKKADKQLIVLIDNIDRIFKNIGDDAALLREQLMNYNDVRIIGGSTVMSEDYWRYDMSFYQFFSIKKLKPLKTNEIKELLAHWAAEKKLPEIASFVDKYPGKVQAIRMLTDGTPRTMLLFVEMLINRPLQNGFDYLNKIVDQATPIYQERLGQLSVQQQKILVELSFFWEATAVEQLIGVCKMPGKTISSQLSNLVKAHLVEKVKGPTKNHFYRLEERFFNLWLLMTQGGPKQKSNAKYLTVFLENWYNRGELKTIYKDFASNLKTNSIEPSYAASMTKALAHSKYLTFRERDEIILSTREISIGKDLKLHLPELSADILKQAQVKYEEGKLEEAFELVESIEQEDGDKFFALAVISEKQEKTELAEKYYLRAIEKDHIDALYNLAILYQKQEKMELAEKYYLLAIEKDHLGALYNLAILYQDQEKTELAEKYYLRAIEKDHLGALYNLAILYQKQEKMELAEKYYLRAIEKDHLGALYNLAILYQKQEKMELAEKYYLLAIEKDHLGALYNLAILYKKQEKMELAEKYYLLAIEKDDIDALYNLAILYQNQEKTELAEKYYLLAIEKGDIDALNNLAILYENQEKTELAEKYYLRAIEKDHLGALNNLAVLFYLENKKMSESIDLFEKLAGIRKPLKTDKLTAQNILHLWSGDLTAFEAGQAEVLKQLINDQPDLLAYYLKRLLIHQQKNYVYALFEKSEHADFLKSANRPLYYAVIKLMNPNDPLLLKTPPELEENINDIIEYIKERQEFYSK